MVFLTYSVGLYPYNLSNNQKGLVHTSHICIEQWPAGVNKLLKKNHIPRTELSCHFITSVGLQSWKKENSFSSMLAHMVGRLRSQIQSPASPVKVERDRSLDPWTSVGLFSSTRLETALTLHIWAVQPPACSQEIRNLTRKFLIMASATSFVSTPVQPTAGECPGHFYVELLWPQIAAVSGWDLQHRLYGVAAKLSRHSIKGYSNWPDCRYRPSPASHYNGTSKRFAFFLITMGLNEGLISLVLSITGFLEY